MGNGSRAVAFAVILAALVAVVLFPLLVFPNPATNDAVGLADAEWPVLLAEIAAAVVVYFTFQGQTGAVVRATVGVFLFGVAVTLVVGLIVFGNLSNDRFGPLLFFPPVLALTGLVGIVVAVAAGVPRHRRELLRGARYGLTMAVVFGVWVIARGARDWLLAPYGFDLLLLIVVMGAGLVLVATQAPVSKSAPPG